MKVLSLVTDAYGGHGGIALYNRELFESIASHPVAPVNTVIPRVVTRAIEPLPRNLRFRSEARGSKLRFALTVLKTLASRPRFDLVLCTHVNLLPFARLARAWCGGKLVLFVYGIDVWQPTGRRLSNVLVRRVDAVASIRRYTAQRLASWAGLREVPTFILENPIRPERYGVRPRDPGLVAKFGLGGRRVLMTLGRVEESRKGFDETLEVLPELAREYADLVYVVAGGGHDVPRLERKARDLGVADRVVFTGPVPEDRKSDYYRLADVFAMPGTGDDFDRYPLRFVFLEAMACGVQVVGCVPELPEESSRMLGLPTIEVDPFDPESIRKGIREALGRPGGRVPEALSRYAFPEFEKKVHAMVDALLPVAEPNPDRAMTSAASARS